MKRAATLRALPREELAPDGPYIVHAGRLCRIRHTKDGPVIMPLCNFVAEVVEEVVLDDGAETARAFTITGALAGAGPLPEVRVPAPRFAGMGWVTEQWGLAAVVCAGMATRDQLREAIQVRSPDARTRHVFTHTGWRELGGRWCFLTAGGALGAEGCEVDLGPELTRYHVPTTTVEDPRGAMQASLRLLAIAPLSVTAPLWGAIFRAPLATLVPVDTSVWIEGQTGSMKSTLAAVMLAHFGPFDRLHLPGAWSSTANQLERRAFLLKDVAFVVDDYAPTPLDARDLEVKASRLLRAAGNAAGRGRLRADLSERPAYPPRGIIIATGEQHPPGQSILARLVVVELEEQMIDLPALTAAQATAPRLPHAMAGYLAWLAPQMPTLATTLPATFTEIRRRATNGGHKRIPEALAHLYLGIDTGLAYAVELGACLPADATALRDQAWAALLEIGEAQGRLVEEERPSRRFLRVLLALLVQGRGALLKREDETAGDHTLGWIDAEYLYLLPEAAWGAVAKFCRETGEPFVIREARLRRDLVKERLSEPVEGRFTATLYLGGRKRRVLRIHRARAEQEVGEAFPEPSDTAGTTGTGPEQ